MRIESIEGIETGEKVEKHEKHETEAISLLRKILIDLEAGKIVRVALDLQALIQDLETLQKERNRAESK
jgi:hypothetical protein